MGGCAVTYYYDRRYNVSCKVCVQAASGWRGTLIMATAVEGRGLKAWFGKTEALHGIDIAVEEKHATAVIGPSGCGKSTFVRCLNRMHETIPEAKAEGDVKIGGMDIYSTPAVDVRRKVGMVFQKPNPFPSMNIYDNVAAGLKLN